MTMAIPFFDHKAMHDSIRDELTDAFTTFLSGDSLILGAEVNAFEDEISAYLSCKHAAGVNSGLDALILALRALGIGTGDEVIVPANTYIATWNAIHLVGAVPVPVDPDSVTMNIDARVILPSINSKTKAILPVHLYGLPCPMSEIMDLAAKYHLHVIEDNAQAVGATVDGKKTGSWGHINATSFYPTKNLGALGDAGMVTGNDTLLTDRVKSLRNYGSSQRYINREIGINSRLDELQAAFLRIKLRKLDHWITARKKLAARYFDGLKDLPQLILPSTDESHTYHLFVIRCNERDALATYLRDRQIATLIHYPIPPHQQEAYQFMGFRQGDFPVSEEIAGTCLSLPLYYGFEQVDEVVGAICSFHTHIKP